MNSKCDNCNWQGEPKITLENIPDLGQRLDPNRGTVPSGQCPECGSLCYAFNPDALIKQTFMSGYLDCHDIPRPIRDGVVLFADMFGSENEDMRVSLMPANYKESLETAQDNDQ